MGPDRYRITGLLTIREHSKEISVLARLTRHASLWAVPENSLLFETAFEVDRLEFGVGKPSHLLGNRVAVNLKLDFRAQMSK